MSLSMYRLCVPAFQRGLTILKTYLDKAEAFAAEKGIDAAAVVGARLAPDMLPLSAQVQRVSDTTKFAVARLAGIEAPSFEDNETTFAELRERVAKTEAFLATVSPEAFEGSEARDVTISPGGVKTVMRGEDYLVTFVLPNLYFHLATVHAILRHEGAAVGKRDYLGPFA
jgi:uncharacterized protein